MCLQHSPATQAHTHQAESDQRSGGESWDFRTEEVWVQESKVSRPENPHLPTLAFGEGGSLPSPAPGQQAQLGIKMAIRQPPGGANIHLLSWVRGWGGPPQPGHLGLWDQRQKHLDCVMPCPPAPAQFINTPHRPARGPKVIHPWSPPRFH